MGIGCYESEMKEIFSQEGIDYDKKNTQFIKEYHNKVKHLSSGIDKTKIPLITHQAYLSSPLNPQKMDAISLRKTIDSINLLNEASNNSFKHYFWTNDATNIPEEIKILPGVEIHLINELENSSIWNSLDSVLKDHSADRSKFAKASDFIRYAALESFGGMYRDLDYEVLKPEEFIKLLNNFDFFGGKEFDYEPVYVGSALVASVKNHPIIKTALNLLIRNAETDKQNLHEYLQFPCDKINKQLYETGPLVITIAFYISANQVGYNDLLLPANILFNWDYARTLIPDSSCYDKNMLVKLNNETIGYDAFCGGWHKNNERYNYPNITNTSLYKANVSDYLYIAAQDGDYEAVLMHLANKANINHLHSVTGASALYIAANNGHIKIVDLLIKHKADLELAWTATGATPLYAAIDSKHPNIVKSLVLAGASILAKTKVGISILQKAKTMANQEIIDFLNANLSTPKGINIDCYSELNHEVYAQENINLDTKNITLKKEFIDKLTNLNTYIAKQKNPIPTSSHQIYLTSKNNQKPFNQVALDKIIISAKRLLDINKEWTFHFWTNDKNAIPKEILALANVKIHLIDELKDGPLYNELNTILQSQEISAFAEASDLIRYMVLQKFGGLYYDLDYEIYNAAKLYQLTQAFNFLAGKEFDEKFSQIGSAFVASVAGHPIINNTVEFIKRNLNPDDSAPDYIKYPCTKYNQRMFSDGPSMLSLATYKSANLNGNIDFVAMSSKVFFNTPYAHYTTAGSSCSKPNQPASLSNEVDGIVIETVGADMLCGFWTPPNYYDPIFHPQNINSYLYVAAQDGDYEAVLSYLQNKADANHIYKTGATPLYIAAHNGHSQVVDLLIEYKADLNIAWLDGDTPLHAAIDKKHIGIVQKLIKAGASIWAKNKAGISILQKAQESKNKEILPIIKDEHKKSLDLTELGCFQGDIADVFTQENIDYYKEDKKLVESSREKFNQLSKYITENQNPIDLKTHQIYFSFNKKTMDTVSLNKTITTLNRLNEADPSWKHHIWTNDLDNIPLKIKQIKGVRVHLIDKLKDSLLYKELISTLAKAASEKHLFTQASDIARLMILYEYGGVYRDLDNEIYRAKELIDLLKAFNFVAGKERHAEVTYIGNAFLAANKKHPIIETAIKDYLIRNLNADTSFLPPYLQYPCKGSVKVIYETGSPVISSAYYTAANLNGNVDIVMPGNVFFNADYAWSHTPSSRCYNPAINASLDNEIDGVRVKTIASDMFCGSSHSMSLIEYPENKDIYLYMAAQDGQIVDVERHLKAGANPNTLRVNSIPPLSMASQKGHTEVVRLLLESKADIEINSEGHTPLYRAVDSRNIETVKILLKYNANIEAKQLNGVSILYKAVDMRLAEIIKLLLIHNANLTNGYKGITPEKHAQDRKYAEITQIFLDHHLFQAASDGDLQKVIDLLDKGANIDSTHIENATPLYIAASHNKINIVDFLIKKRADINKAVIDGDTPLYIAASKGYSKIVKSLLDAKADLEAKVDGIYTALLIAIYFSHKEVVKLLLEAGANPLNDDEFTAFTAQLFKQKKTPLDTEIHQLVVKHYQSLLDDLVKQYTPKTKISFEVVVARYNEDISWVLKEFPNENIIIYNKGEDNLGDLPSNVSVIKLPNIGREAHTYLYHIINNYDHLTDRIMFLQGNPYEHPLFLPLIRYKDNIGLNCKNIIAKCQSPVSLQDLTEDTTKQQKKIFPHLKTDYNLTKFLHQFINPSYPTESDNTSVNGAQFAVDKKIILNNSKNYYQKLLTTLKTIDPIEGYYFERLWDVIFIAKPILNQTNEIQGEDAQPILIDERSGVQQNSSGSFKMENGITKNSAPIENQSLLNTSLFNAASIGDASAVTNALEQGADINNTDLGATALYIAAQNNRSEVVTLLIKKANLEIPTKNGATPLYVASFRGHTSIAEALLKAGANIEAMTKANPNDETKTGVNTGSTPLKAAIHNKQTATVKLLLSYGAKIISDDYYYTALVKAEAKKNDSPEHYKIFQIITEHYWKLLENYHSNIKIEKTAKSFEVVVVRYSEDLSWLLKEFPNEKVTIYNKGADDLTNLPKNYKVVKIDNTGFLGGTYLYHIVNNYESLANRVLFLQGYPYDQGLYLPLIRHKDEIESNCNNIIAKCQDTTLLKETNELNANTEEDWTNGKYSKFGPIAYDMTEFMHKFVNPSYSANATLKMALGAQFAVDSGKIFAHSKDYYINMLDEFSKDFPRQDFFLEKLWDEVFEKNNSALIEGLVKQKKVFNKQLFEAAKNGNLNSALDALEHGAGINNKDLGATPIYIAAKNNKLEIVKLLISKGATIEIASPGGATPLYTAVINCHSLVTKALLDAKANTEVKVDNKTPLFVAISSACVQNVKHLLNAGAKLYNDEVSYDVINAPLALSSYLYNENKENKIFEEIFHLVSNHYFQNLEKEIHQIKKVSSNNNQSFEVVVARYNEDLSWLLKEFPDQKITIYNKGEAYLGPLPKNTTVIQLKNVGRDIHTHLYHIANNYKKLSDRTLFLQGNPYDSSAMFLPLIRYKFGENKNCLNIFAKCDTSTLKQEDLFLKAMDWKNSKYDNIVSDSVDIINFTQQYIGKYSIDAPLHLVFGAQFAVDKEKIYNHSIDFYNAIISILSKNNSSIEVHYIERLLDWLFATNTDTQEIQENLDQSLFDAASAGDLDAALILIELKANVNKAHAHTENATALYMAAFNGHKEMVDLLLKNGADIEAAINSGETALYIAADKGYADVVATLIANGANKEVVVDHYTPFYIAAHSGHPEVVKIFLDSNTNFYLNDDFIQPIVRAAATHVGKSPKYNEVYQLIMDKYWDSIKPSSNDKSFEVVIVRYNEDLSWIEKEFPNEKVTIYNKGANDLGYLPKNYIVKNIENTGYLGGTYLLHITTEYKNLAERVLFLQGNPYDVPIHLPLSQYKDLSPSSCKNIVAKCTLSTLEKEKDTLANIDWKNHPLYSNFEPIKLDIVDFTHKYISNYSSSAPLYFPFGAEFAVDREKIYSHPVDYYEKILPELNNRPELDSRFPMTDHYMERVWDLLLGDYNTTMQI